jgi:4-carboxymuconolactone decarboxylase
MSKEVFERGKAIREEVLGTEYVTNALKNVDDFNRDFQALVTEYCWGAGWGRGVLEKKTRSMLNLVMLSALNRQHEFELHFKGAIRNGCTIDELREVLIQVAIYCGIPAGVEAFRNARKILADNPELAAKAKGQ